MEQGDSVIIVAGGRGRRMGGSVPKQFREVGGVPVLMRTIARFHEYSAALAIIVVLPADQQEEWRRLCRRHAFAVPHTVATGGDTRFASVAAGLAATMAAGDVAFQPHAGGAGFRPHAGRLGFCPSAPLAHDISLAGRGCGRKPAPPACGRKPTPPATSPATPPTAPVIAVHDGVRPFVSLATIRRAFDAARRTGAAVPVVPVVETLRHVEHGTVPRDSYRLVQTPQVFRADVLRQAYRQPYRDNFTDDASVVEAAGGQITLVEGNRENIKLTTPFDLVIGEALISN